MTVNLHTHTVRCGHAKGADRDYIENAIQGGLTHLGFADHMPFVFPDGHESSFRIPMAERQDYMDSLRSLREEYCDRITIHIGFEMEYYPLYFKDMLKISTELGAEFLLLSQHYVKNEYPNGSKYMGKPTDSEEELILYADTLLEAMETGIFTYAAHPDLIHFVGDNHALYEEQVRRICQGARAHDLPLELNLLGVRDHRHYPNRRFWEIAAEEGCEVVIGCDAHQPEVVTDERSLAVALQWIAELGLNYNPHPKLIHPVTGAVTLTE